VNDDRFRFPEIPFEIVGVPTPQGSKTKMPNGAMVEGGSKAARDAKRDWRTTVAQVARDVAETIPDAPLDEPLRLVVQFRFPMPTSRPKAVREAGVALKQSAPDLDKLLRALGDGLQSGGLIRDDARICPDRTRRRSK
jgi:Holliday junction resolvase RusA-like endonuclease